MEQTIENYDESKVESVKHFLKSKVDKKHPTTGESQARYYEIFVDSLKVVERTNDPEEFDSYTDFLQDGTKEVRVLIYTASAAAPKLMTKHVFRLQSEEPKKEAGLSGTEIAERIKEAVTTERKNWELDQLKKDLEATKNNSSLSGLEMQSKITDGVSSEMQKWEMTQLKKELAETEKSLEEAEEYIDELEKLTEELKHKKGLEDLKAGEAVGLFAEGIIRRNVHLLNKVPIAKGLAGVIAEDNERKAREEESPENPIAETTFKEKQQEPQQNSLSPQMKQRITVIQQMEKAFDQEEVNTLMKIINVLSAKKESLQVVADLLNIKK